MAVIGLTVVTLIGAQSHSVSIAAASRFETMAAFLAQKQMTELIQLPFDELSTEEGDFGEDFPEYGWRIDVETLTEDDTGITGADDVLKTVDLTVFAVANDRQQFFLRTIVLREIPDGGF